LARPACVLLRREGLVQNHERTEWLYREEGLSLRLKRRKKRPSYLRVVMPAPNGADESWTMDLWSTCKPQAQTGGDRRLAFIYPAYSDPIEAGSGLHDVVARFRPN